MIERPTNGANTSGKSVSTSIVNIGRVFNLRRFLAPLQRKPLTPYELALQSLVRGEYAAALQQLDALLEEETRGEQRAALSNKRGVALVSLLRRDEARQAFDDALAARPRYAPAL